MEIIQSDERLAQLHADGTGFILNDFEGAARTSSSRDFNKLHRAGCDWCNTNRQKNAMTVKTSGQKIFFGTAAEAADWLIRNRAGNYSRCAHCNPR